MSRKRAPFTPTPPPRKIAQHIDLVRCGPKSLGPYLVTSREFGGTQVFWLRGRSCPHSDQQCEGCELKLRHNWYGWLSCWNAEKRCNIIVEVTDRCAEAINQYITDYGSIRGAMLTLSRKNGKFNGPLSITLVPSALKPADIPEPCDVQQHLDDLWDAPSESEKGKLKSPRNYAEPKEVTELRAASRTKAYEPTDEQRAMIAANKARAEMDLEEAKKLVTKRMTRVEVRGLGVRPEVAKALCQWIKDKWPAETNGQKH